MVSTTDPTRERPSLWADLLAFDRAKLSLRRGLDGVFVLLLTLVLVALVGTVGVTAGLAALIVLAAASAAPLRSRVGSALVIALLGSLLTLIGVWAGEEGWAAAALMTVVSLAATLSAAYGKGAATAAYLLNLWVLISLLLTASDHDPLRFAGAFLLGGVLGVGLIALRVARGDESADEHQVVQAPPAAEPEPGRWAPLRSQLTTTSPLLRFAMVRAIAAGGTTLIGWYLFPAHPYWAVLTAFVIIQTDTSQTLVLGLNRATGTMVAVLLMVPLLDSVDSSPLLLAAFVVSGFLMLSVQKVNYALFTFFTTVVILLMERLTHGDAYATGWDRLFATLLGVALAFGVIAIGRMLGRRIAAG